MRNKIISEIQRLARENAGKPPGRNKFTKETNIKVSEWYPNLWLRWGDALNEAGFDKNNYIVAYEKESLILNYIDLIRELKHFPIAGELRHKKKSDSTFPSHNVFDRLGNKAERAREILNYCFTKDEFKDVIEYCEKITSTETKSEKDETINDSKIGYVYLIQHGKRKEYKIGRTFNPIRREGEIRLELPEKVTPIHTITTDDPSGIERYWHTRFANKRKEGEWFELTHGDVRAFKKWKQIH